MKNKVILLMVVLLGFTACKRQSSFYERCKNDAKEQTKRLCPRQIDKGIILDSINFLEKQRTFEYFYTMEDSLFPPELLNAHKEDLRALLCKSLKNSIELKRYKENNIAFQYIYFYRHSGEQALIYTFTKADYK